MKKILLSVAACMMLMSAVMGQNPGLPVMEREGEPCYFYTLKGDESVFGILARFGWDEDTFMLYNPKAAELKKGGVVYYPTGQTTLAASADEPEAAPALEPTLAVEPSQETMLPTTSYTPGDTLTYTVKQGDTLYALARAYHTTVADIFRANRGLREQDLAAGMEIHIVPSRPTDRMRPTQAVRKLVTGKHQYKLAQGDTWLSLATNLGVDTTTLINLNGSPVLPGKGKKIYLPDLRDTLVTVMTEVIDPLEQTADGRLSIYRAVHGINAGRPTEITILSSSDADDHKRGLEFVRGFLLALEGFKAAGHPVTLHVQRVDADALTPASIAADSVLAVSDIIITTFDKNFPNMLADYAERHDKQVINVFDAKSEAYARYSTAMQMLTPSADFYPACVDFLLADKPDAKYIFVAEDEPDGECASLILLERLIREGGNYETIPSYADLQSYTFLPGRSYVVVSDLNRRADINKFTSELLPIVEQNPGARISVVGRPTWVLYADQLKDRLRSLDTYIPSRFYMDPDDPAVKAFESAYAEAYGFSTVKSFPAYAAMGYDMARYLLDNLTEHNGDINAAESTTDALQLDIRLTRPELWKGLVNSNVYLLHFTPYDTTDKIRL